MWSYFRSVPAARGRREFEGGLPAGVIGLVAINIKALVLYMDWRCSVDQSAYLPTFWELVQVSVAVLLGALCGWSRSIRIAPTSTI